MRSSALAVWVFSFIVSSAQAAVAGDPTLAEARAMWRDGRPLDAADHLAPLKTVEARAMRGLALAAAGDDAEAIESLVYVPSNHVLYGVTVPVLVGAMRRLGRYDQALDITRSDVKKKLPGALYLQADVETAMRGCKAIASHRAALKKERHATGRHASRRMIARCSLDAVEKIRIAIAMLDDPEPIDSDLARMTLQTVVDAHGAKLKLPFDVAMRLVEKLFFERLPDRAVVVLSTIAEPADPTDRARVTLFHAQALSIAGKKAERMALLEAGRRRGVGTLDATFAKLLVDARVADLPQAERAAAYLKLADEIPDDPIALECRHLGAYHLSEAGRLKEAVEQWDLVASQPWTKRRDAAWFAAQRVASGGELVRASDRARALSQRESDSQWAALFSYWSARWLLDAGKKDEAAEAFNRACTSWPARLHGRFACARIGKAPRAPELPEPLPSDAFLVVEKLANEPALPPRVKPNVQRALAFAEIGAWAAARAELRRERGILMRAPESIALAFGEAALALNDTQSSVILAEGRRVDVDRLDEPRWVRIAYPWRIEVAEAAQREGVDPYLAHAIARTESYFDPSVRSPAGAIGLMQLLPTTARELAGRGKIPNLDEDTLWDPLTNALLGSRYVRLIAADFGPRVELIAAAYNAGPNAARTFVERGRNLPLDAFLEAINYRETRGYARKVLEGTLMYRAAGGQKPVVDPLQPMDVTPASNVQF